jgi:hypothetical protein
MKAEILDALVKAGATAEMIVAAIKAEQDAAEAKRAEKRARDAERKRRSRANVRNVTRTDADMGVTSRDTPPPSSPSSFPPIPPHITTPSPPTPAAAAEGARARDGGEMKQAMDIADEAARIADLDPANVPPGWCGFPNLIVAGMRAGWSREDVITGVRSVMTRRAREGPPASFAYFKGAIADAHATRTAPIPAGRPNAPDHPGQTSARSRAGARPLAGDALIAGFAAALAERPDSRLYAGDAGGWEAGPDADLDDCPEPRAIAAGPGRP